MLDIICDFAFERIATLEERWRLVEARGGALEQDTEHSPGA
jgi:hypothetical protein